MPKGEAMRALMRPALARRFCNFALAYVAMVTFVNPLLNVYAAAQLPTQVDLGVLGLLLSQPMAWVFGRTVEKSVKNAKVADRPADSD